MPSFLMFQEIVLSSQQDIKTGKGRRDMVNEIKLTEFQFDMLPSDDNKLVLENFIFLDDNLDSTEDLELDSHISKQIFPLKLMFPLTMICRQGEIKMQINLVWLPNMCRTKKDENIRLYKEGSFCSWRKVRLFKSRV